MATLESRTAADARPSPPTEPSSTVLAVLLVALAYFATGRLGLALAIPPGYATAIWPPSGIALAAVLLYGSRCWPGIALGSLLINVTTGFDAGSPAALALSLAVPAAIGLGAALQAVLGARLARRIGAFPGPLADVGQVARLLLAGGLLATLTNATVGSGVLLLAGRIPLANLPYTFATWWMGDAVGVFVFTPLLLAWLAADRAAWRERRVPLTATLLAAFTATIVLVGYTTALERRAFDQEFRERSGSLLGQVERGLGTYLQAVAAVEGLEASGRGRGRREFALFAARIRAHVPGMKALEWIPRVAASDRTVFEQSVRAEGLIGFEISELGDRGLVRAPGRPDYFPVTWIEPLEGNRQALGLDVASHPARAAALARARDRGEPALSEPIDLVQGERGLLLFMPVYRPDLPHGTDEERQAALVGFAAGVFRPVDLVEAARIGGELLEGLALWLIDDSDPAHPTLLYNRDGVAPAPFQLVEHGLFGGKMGLEQRLPLAVGGRSWVLVTAPTQAFLARHRLQNAWFVLAGGLLLSSLLGAFVLVVTGHGLALRVLVEERTAALAESEQRYRAAFEQAADAIVVHVDGRVLFVNPAAVRAAGAVRADELIGRPVLDFIYPEDRPRAVARLAEAQSLGAGRGYAEMRMLTLHGETVEMETVTTLLPFAGRPAMQTVFRDIRKRKEAERALIAARRQSELLLASAGEGICGLDAAGVVTFINPAARAMLGLGREEGVGQQLHALAGHHRSEGECPPQECPLHLTLQDGRPRQSSNDLFRRRDGGDFPVDVSINPVLDGEQVTGAVCLFRDVTERRRDQERIRQLAYFDSLTGLPNRRMLMDRLESALVQARRHHRSMAVLFLDLDRFKQVNDTLGHDVGDELLQQVAARLIECVRAGDTVSRQGGDEFVIVLAEIAAPADAYGTAERILAALEKPIELKSHRPGITTSIGIAIYPIDGTDDSRALMKKADAAMYVAKAAGRNRYAAATTG